MSHGTNTTVECPLCGASFDPSAAGGWCTDSDCGDWQYEGDDASDFDDETSGTERTAADGGTAPAGADADETPAEAQGDQEEHSDEETDLSCPACGGDVEAADNFCRSCGTDVSHVEPGSTELSACPACETEVESADSFCRTCGENLDAYRPGVNAQAAPPGRSNGAVGTGESAASGGTPSTDGVSEATGESVASAVEAAASDEASESAEAAESGQSSESDDGPRLALVVRNREIQVADGDTVGRKIRSIIMDTGGDEEDAVRVHREHLQFERTDEQFHVVDLGRNQTIVNGERLEQGDRVPVSAGDRIELSGIANIQVQSA